MVASSFSDLQWIYNVTPLSSLQAIVVTWLLYAVTIVGLRAWMRDRQPFALKTATTMHNIVLCAASGAICIGMVRETSRRARTRGTDDIFCTNDQKTLAGTWTGWMYLYYLMRFYELLDTVILVLKKKPLIFLHVYHHAIVILMVWTWLQYGIVFSALGSIANTGVHVCMYSYYAAPRFFRALKPWLTSLQILQFCASFVLSAVYLRKGCFGKSRRESSLAFVFSMCVNASFLALFVHFYRTNYNRARPKRL